MKRIFLVTVLLSLATAGCERDNRESPYQPGGTFSKKLDADGRRFVIRSAKGEVLAKLREKTGGLKVYDSQMARVGEVLWDEKQIRVERRESDPIAFTSPSPGVFLLGETLRIEAVDRGWAVFDSTAKRLGYFERLEDGRLALRDDYSSAPRVYGTIEDGSAKTPTGAAVLSTTPAYSSVVLLPFAIDGLDPLDKVALGVWLDQQPVPTPVEGPTQAE